MASDDRDSGLAGKVVRCWKCGKASTLKAGEGIGPERKPEMGVLRAADDGCIVFPERERAPLAGPLGVGECQIRAPSHRRRSGNLRREWSSANHKDRCYHGRRRLCLPTSLFWTACDGLSGGIDDLDGRLQDEGLCPLEHDARGEGLRPPSQADQSEAGRGQERGHEG